MQDGNTEMLKQLVQGTRGTSKSSQLWCRVKQAEKSVTESTDAGVRCEWSRLICDVSGFVSGGHGVFEIPGGLTQTS